MDYLYKYEGYPPAFSFKFVMEKIVKQESVSLYNTVSYSITPTNTWLMYIGTAISVIAGILSLNVADLLAIASFAYTVYGGYTLLTDVGFTRYDVTVFQLKDCLHGQSIPYSTQSNI